MGFLGFILAIWFFGSLASIFFKASWWLFKAAIGFVGFIFLLGFFALLF